MGECIKCGNISVAMPLCLDCDTTGSDIREMRETTEKLFCLALLDESVDVINRVTSTYLRYRERVNDAGELGTTAFDAVLAALEGEVVSTPPNT